MNRLMEHPVKICNSIFVYVSFWSSFSSFYISILVLSKSNKSLVTFFTTRWFTKINFLQVIWTRKKEKDTQMLFWNIAAINTFLYRMTIYTITFQINPHHMPHYYRSKSNCYIIYLLFPKRNLLFHVLKEAYV